MNFKNLKEKQGITLIALIITIIVLLILAGVSIAMLTGDNGILTRTKSSKKTSEIAGIKEEIKTEIIAEQAGNEGNISESALKTILEKYGTINYDEDGKKIKSITTKKEGYEIAMKDIWDGNVRGTVSVALEEGDGTKAGDIIAITSKKGTTERFYVLADNQDKTKVKALTEWNLKVGNIYNNNSSTAISTDSDGYGLQNSEMKGWVSSGQTYNGVLAFSDSWYFKDNFANYPVDKDGNSCVYDSNSKLYTYVNNYKDLLGNEDKVSEVSLASYADINALWSNKSNYPWLCNTSYWLWSAYGASSDLVWSIFGSEGYCNPITCTNGSTFGVRPVITVDISNI